MKTERAFDVDGLGYVTMTPIGQKPLKLGQIKESKNILYFFMNQRLKPMGYGVYLELIKLMSPEDYIIICVSSDYENEFKQLKVKEVLELGSLQVNPNYKGARKRIWVKPEDWDNLKLDFESLALKVPKTFGFRTGK